MEIIIKYLAQGGTGYIYFLSLWLSFAFSRTSLLGLSPPLHNSFPFQLDYWHTLVSPTLKILLWVLIQIVLLIKACPNLSCSQILVDPQSLEQCLAYISHSVTIYRMNLSILLHRHTSQNGGLYFSLLLLPLDFSLLISPFKWGFCPHNSTETFLVSMTSELHVVKSSDCLADF